MTGPVRFDGDTLHALCTRLYPLPRSLTGPGVDATLEVLREHLAERAPDAPALERHALSSGTQVFDWRVPEQWTPRNAWIRGPDGIKRADFAAHSLHLVGYSEPVHARMSLEALQPHLHSLPDRPDWIPYRTSYYQRTWGFCLTDRERRSLPPGEYEVFIDADLGPGELAWGEIVLPGETDSEILLWAHLCHPSLANDNLSGLSVATAVAAQWAGSRHRHTLRVVFAPATVGAIAWLASNGRARTNIAHALVLSNLGDAGGFHYKRSRDGDAELDHLFEHLFASGAGGEAPALEPFTPYGYDERQFNSPGIRIPAGCLTRTPHGRYPQYHTSGDDLSFISPGALADACELVWRALSALDGNRHYVNLAPFGEPQLGRRGLYDSLGGENERRENQLAMLWVLNQSDGSHSLLDIARRAEVPFERMRAVADSLLEAGLLQEESAPRRPTTTSSGAPTTGCDGSEVS
jgi:aminopeptidase-like protein